MAAFWRGGLILRTASPGRSVCTAPLQSSSSVLPDDSVCTMLELTLNPFMLPGDPVGQELTVLVNDIDVGGDKIHGEGTVSYVLPQEAIRPDNEWTVTLIHPEAKRPAELGFNDDNRMLGFSLRKAAVVRSDPLPSVAARPHPLPAVPLPDSQDASVLKPALREVTGLVAEDLAGSFESLGHNCEFGMMQRHCGIEPFGLFRFAGVTLEDLLGGLDQAFEGLGTLDQVEAFSSDGIRREFLIRDRHYNISIHTLRFEDETTAEIVRREQSGQLRFFKRNFIEILESGEKLFVFQRPGQTLQSQMRPLLTRLRHYGPNGLLFVTDRPKSPAGNGGAARIWPVSRLHGPLCAARGCWAVQSARLAKPLRQCKAPVERTAGRGIMNRREIETVFQDLVRDALQNPVLIVDRTHSAADYAGWDSVRQVAMILAVEDRFGITLRSREIDALRTVGDFLDLIEVKDLLRPITGL